MPTVTIRPDGDTAVGGFSNAPINAVLSDSNDATFTNNTSQNQTFIVSLDDVSLSGATFNSWNVTVRAKKGGKGNASCNARLFDSSFAVNSVSSLSVTSSSYFNYQFGASFPGGFSDSDADTLSIRLDTTGGTQVFIAEIFVTIDYTGVSGYGHDVNSLASANIGKVNTVATANIGKVNSVD
tara:strand:- start:3286 stop:3831 length:546 start_codon:yes stop_codon:yes gene_type:complete